MMKNTRTVASLVGFGLVLASCATGPQGKSPIANPVPDATATSGSNLPLGAVMGGRRNRAVILANAGIAPIGGATVRDYMDRQERALRTRIAGSGVTIDRQGAEISLRFPAAVTFDFNAASIKPEMRPALDQVVQTLTAYKSTFVDVAGFTDAVGTDTVNQKLSEQRAQAVADYLAYQGIARARLAIRGFGKQLPIAPNDNETGRAQNRRVEIKLSPVTEQDYRG